MLSKRVVSGQRLREYSVEHSAVLGFSASATALGAVGGRTKCAHGIGIGGSGGPGVDEMDEDWIEMGSEMEEVDKED
jgi:hypothetical protein